MLNVIHSSVITGDGNTDIDIGHSLGSLPGGDNAVPGQAAVLMIMPGEDWSAGTVKLQEDDDNDGTYSDITGATLTGAAESPAPLIKEITLHENMRINAASMAGASGARVAILSAS